MTDLAGKVALVAGASGGINLAIAEAIGRAGATVVVLSRSTERIEAAAARLSGEGIAAEGIACDVRDHPALAATFSDIAKRLGPLDIVVSGAAGNFLAPAAKLTPNGFKTIVDIDLVGTFNVFHAAFPHLRRPGAALVAVTAGQAVNPMPFQVHACAAKAGVNMVIKCLALEWGPAGIRVNGVSPGPISGTEGMTRLAPDVEQEMALKGRLALRRYGTTDDVANATLYLVSDVARYVTGAILNVDGGNDLGDASADALN